MIQCEGAISPEPLRVFVVENHKDTLLWLTRYLEMLGHTVLSARTKKEALEALPKAGCAVLISDIGLPDGDGWELLRTAALAHPETHPAARPIFAIAMSGFGMTADRAKSVAAGYRHHILKPFDPGILDAILEEAARECGKSTTIGEIGARNQK
jgi:two-component system CheB/CheR fusion protein